MSKLVFELSAPMQSYVPPTSSNIQYTDKKPRTDAIVGLLSAALGYRRGDQRIDDLKNAIDIKVKTIKNDEVPLVDYQNCHYLKGNQVKNKQLWRSYLQDASFEISINGSDILLEKLKQALLKPYFALACGRRSCPPARPIVPKIVN